MPLQTVHTGFTFNFDGSKLSAIQKGVGNAKTHLNTLAAKTEIFSEKMGGFFQRAKQIVGAYLGFRAVKSVTMDYANAADAVAKFSKALGLSAETYQGMTHAAAMAGVTVEQLNPALSKIGAKAIEASKGSKELRAAFGALGIRADELKGMDVEQLLFRVSDGFAKMEAGGKRTQVALKLFEEMGPKLLNAFSLGSEGIKRATEEAKRLGIIMSGKQLKAAEDYKDAMLRLKSIIIGVRNIIAAKLLPTITKNLEAFRKWWTEGKNAERALRALKLIAFFTGLVIAAMFKGTVVKQVTKFVQGIWAGVQALRAMGAAGAAAHLKIWALLAVFALIGLIIEDLVGFAQGKDSVIGRILGPSKLADDLKKGLLDIGRSAVKAWKELKPALLDAWKALQPSLRELATLLKPLAGPTFKLAIMSLISALHILNFSIQQVTVAIRVLRDAGSAVASALKSAGNIVAVAWEEATDTIKDGLKDAKGLAKNIAGAMGLDLGRAAREIGKAWDLATSGIRKTLDTIVSAANTALAALAAVTGKGKAGVALGAGATAALAAAGKAPAVSPTGQLVMPGLFMPRGVEAFRGVGAPTVTAGLPSPRAFGLGAATGGLQQRIANVSVAAGAVQVTTSATGDPSQIAAAQNIAIVKGLNKVITDASRDLVKPPRGQR